MELHVIETRPDSLEYPWEFHANDASYKIYQLGNPPDPEQGFIGKELRTKIEKILKELTPEVIVTVGWADQEYHETLLWAMAHQVPCSVISDSGWDDVKRHYLTEKLKQLIVSCFSSALVAGKRSKDYLEKLGMPGENIFTAWDVVDNEYYAKTVADLKERRRDDFNLPDQYWLCVSRFISKKNLLGLIRAFDQFVKSGGEAYTLLLLGTGELEEEIKNEVLKRGLPERVILPGFVQIEELPNYYAFAEALILPSFADQWGLVVNEAMASGLPVLVSRQCGCTDDIVMNGINGFIFDAFDEADMIKAMTNFHALSQDQRSRFSAESKKIISNYNLNAFAEGLKKAAEKAKENFAGYRLNQKVILKAIRSVDRFR